MEAGHLVASSILLEFRDVPWFRLLPHARMHRNEINLVAGVLPASSRPGEPPRIEVVLRAEIRQGSIVGIVEGQAGELPGAAIVEGDPDADAVGVMPVHPDEAVCVLLECNQGNLLSWWAHLQSGAESLRAHTSHAGKKGWEAHS